MDASCTKTIRRYLNNEKIKHEKKLHRPRLTVKYRKKRLEYARQYQTMNAKNGEKLFSRTKMNSIKTVKVALRSTGTQKNFPEENYSMHSGGGSLMIWWGVFLSSGKLNHNWSTVDKSSRLCEEAKWFISCTRGASFRWRRGIS